MLAALENATDLAARQLRPRPETEERPRAGEDEANETRRGNCSKDKEDKDKRGRRGPEAMSAMGAGRGKRGCGVVDLHIHGAHLANVDPEAFAQAAAGAVANASALPLESVLVENVREGSIRADLRVQGVEGGVDAMLVALAGDGEAMSPLAAQLCELAKAEDCRVEFARRADAPRRPAGLLLAASVVLLLCLLPRCARCVKARRAPTRAVNVLPSPTAAVSEQAFAGRDEEMAAGAGLDLEQGDCKDKVSVATPSTQDGGSRSLSGTFEVYPDLPRPA